MASRDIKDCTPLLQEFWPLLKARYEKEFPGRVLDLSCTHRPVVEQQTLFKQNKKGNILTKCDGVNRLSKHNYDPSKAFDAFVSIGGKAVWDKPYYTPLLGYIADLGYYGRIRSGGTFPFPDWPHMEEI